MIGKRVNGAYINVCIYDYMYNYMYVYIYMIICSIICMFIYMFICLYVDINYKCTHLHYSILTLDTKL
jgi:hypothetical protein